MKKILSDKLYRLIRDTEPVEKMRHKLKRLNTCSDMEAEKRCQEYLYTTFIRILALLSVFFILGIGIAIREGRSSGAVVLKRDSYGGDSSVKTLETEVGGEKTAVDVEVLPVTYDKDELLDAFDRGFKVIDELYLGENESADKVQSDLNLITSIDELGLEVSWLSDTPEVVSSKGIVTNDDPDINTAVCLTAKLYCQDEGAERNYEIRVVGKEPDDRVKAAKVIGDYVRDAQDKKPSDREITLPDSIEGYEIKDKGKAGGGFVMFGLGIIAAICVWAGASAGLKEKEKQRKEQLMMDYPSLVDKLMLYIGSGITVKSAFVRIAKDAESGGNVKNRYLISEIRYMLNEIQAGIGEGDAYYNMGHRINIPVYIKLMSTLSQNVSKGTKDILIMMSAEQQAAVQTRKECARKKGEEAGTKLLFPMIVLLGVVMIIVILPAILNF